MPHLGPGSGLRRLSILTFFLFFGAGAVSPIMGLYLTRYLHMSGGVAGAVLAFSALGSVAAPLLSAMVADRFIRAERLLAICLFGGAVMVYWLSKVNSALAVFALYGSYALLFGPAITLNNVVIFHHVENTGGDYGRIRVFGTFGWMAVAWVFSWFWLRGADGRVLPERLADALVLAALVYAAMGIFSLSLPSTKPSRQSSRPGLLPKEAWTIIAKPDILALVAAMALWIITDRFYFYGGAIFLRQNGLDESRILPMLSLGQIFEIPAMAYLGYLLSKLGIKKVLLIGLACNGCRFILFSLAAGRADWMVAGIFFHGLTFALFSCAAFVCLDTFVTPANRAGVHLLFTILTNGLGTVVGNISSGLISAYATEGPGMPDFRVFWGVCFGLVILSMLCIAWRFNSVTPAPAIVTPSDFPDEPS
jgi:MFS family permease